jgi:hypothetical protein
MNALAILAMHHQVSALAILARHHQITALAIFDNAKVKKPGSTAGQLSLNRGKALRHFAGDDINAQLLG